MVSIISNTQIGNKPKISVVMPAFNAAKTIANAIMSILNQTEQDFELVIIDDGSTDNTEKVIAQFKDERIRYYAFPHRGLVHARNTGNSLAKADVIAIQDADDLSLPRRLEICWEYLNTGFDVVIHGAMINMWDTQYQCISRKYLPPGDQFDVAGLLNGQTLTGWPVFKKSVWEAKPFRYETQYAYDWMMHLDWILNLFRYAATDEVLYEYVRQQGSASQIFERDGRRAESMKKIKEILKNEYAQS